MLLKRCKKEDEEKIRNKNKKNGWKRFNAWMKWDGWEENL